MATKIVKGEMAAFSGETPPQKKTVPPYSGHRRRLRDRFENAGLAALAEHEKLELLLTYAVPRRDVKPYARELVEKFGSAAAALDATPQELQEFGLGQPTAVLFRLFKEFGAEYLKQPMRKQDILASEDDVVNYLRMKLGGERKETLAVLYLNQRNGLIGCDTYQGTVDHALVYPNDIAEQALLRHATGVIIAHNHPSGICAPSAADINATERVRQALAALRIPLHEHLIVTPSAHCCLLKHMQAQTLSRWQLQPEKEKK